MWVRNSVSNSSAVSKRVVTTQTPPLTINRSLSELARLIAGQPIGLAPAGLDEIRPEFFAQAID